MTPERLTQILAAYGSRPERWPEGERADAMALLESGQAGHLDAERLDRALDRLTVAHPDAALVGQALAGFAASSSLLRRWWFAPLLAGSGALGVATGALILALTPIDRRAGWGDEHMTIFSAPADLEESSL
ncbi:hypothetical protein KRR38_03490 [Novosphingobium sp. G106]|uniref:hypothetical protein n=1 Tax=Novosphingobium sp. G106 TaxID=2849500 RepID=UPI001C2CCA2C|nr:hypothetical protein [Novosphingobium sp. G106]MBV1686759.1 hypothetical protein [Novosphingobium sp. G106]